ncbi:MULTISPECIES: hypothetical protein [unclassified Desulfurobacterium]|uniref:hypothetical protein n=1 Tax=Desulfurobacterium sp. TC5-1 TaxID=1158318 RepID=UPI0003B5B374|nr:hypothetical protein [Desulfurobacterium sp. TC5-1]
MLEIEKVLFLALKAFHPWEISIKLPESEGAIYVENKMIVAAELKKKNKTLKDFEAFKEIIKRRREIEKLDIFPLRNKVENRMSCDIYCVMQMLEEIEAITPGEKSWIEEFLLNLISLDSNWVVNLQSATFKGKLYLKDRKYIDAYFLDKITKEVFTGKEALNRIVKHRNEIQTAELQPMKEPCQEKFTIGFMDFFELLNKD